ncbi:hypothetical protein [Clostridium cibarium]|uniref:Uncharacterized protein n=1 Tax=Clostridium cibarium TaxID=2762247 RepID=A0ABR8PQW5_9CLOT|nr:hypothetical protein [Clostridium cibarium]MBD7910564.1 hypothetical protein [Clostridium cibarium]
MKRDKVDKGFEALYFNLSYRRKFKRTLWTLPFVIVMLLFILLSGGNISRNLLISAFVIIGVLVQLIYTYLMWKREE